MPFHDRKLNDGTKIPAIAFGSAGYSNSETYQLIQQAINAGFRHIDTAQNYGNEREVGDAIRSHPTVPREHIWITTKFSCPETDFPLSACRKSLDALGVDYVDQYLIHGPEMTRNDILGCWKEMEEVKKRGWAKSIGVSNFEIDDLKILLAFATIPPSVNQIRLDPDYIATLQPLLDFMFEHNIAVEGFSSIEPLWGKGSDAMRKAIAKLAEKRRVKDEVVCLAWAKAKGAIIVTRSRSLDRLKRYMSVGDMDLTDDEVETIDKAGRKASVDAQRRAMVWRGAKVMAGAAVLAGALYRWKAFTPFLSTIWKAWMRD